MTEAAEVGGVGGTGDGARGRSVPKRNHLAVRGLLVALMGIALPSKSIPAAILGLLLPPLDAAMVIAGYLALGAAGLPVFTGRAGAGLFFGPDGGFILAPLAQAPVTSWVYRLRPGLEARHLVPPVVVGLLVHLAMGTLGGIYLGGYPVRAAWIGAALTAPWILTKVVLTCAVFRAVAPKLGGVLGRPWEPAGRPAAETRGEGRAAAA